MNEQKVSVSVEQRIFIKFRTAEGIQSSEILQWLKKQFGEPCLSINRVLEWCENFREGKREKGERVETCRIGQSSIANINTLSNILLELQGSSPP